MLNKMNSMLRREDGFTLMELMIVVVIIGILMAIAIPIYNNVQTGIREKVGDANADMLNRGVITWIALEGGKGSVPAERKDYEHAEHFPDLYKYLALEKNVEFVKVGSEEIDGKTCVKYLRDATPGAGFNEEGGPIT